MDKVVKALPVELKGIDEQTRTLIAVASTESRDRDGDIIRVAGWDLANFMKNPVIPWAHDYAGLPVAIAKRVWVEDDRLMFEAEFQPAEANHFADMVFRLYAGGFLRAFSVGFRALERKQILDEAGRWTGTEYLRQELYEISACSVPANPEALVVMQANGAIDAKDATLAKALGAQAPAALTADLIRQELKRIITTEELMRLAGFEANATDKGDTPAEQAASDDQPQPGDQPAESGEQPQPGGEPDLDHGALHAAARRRAAEIAAKFIKQRIDYHLGRVA